MIIFSILKYIFLLLMIFYFVAQIYSAFKYSTGAEEFEKERIFYCLGLALLFGTLSFFVHYVEIKITNSNAEHKNTPIILEEK